MTYPYTRTVVMTFLLFTGIGMLFAAKPAPDPPAESSRFACFTVQNFGTAVCFDKSDQFLLRELVADPRITEVFPYGEQAHNVVATVDEVVAALSN